MIHIYARVSTLEQSGPDKTSITEQLAKCKAVAQLRGPVGKYDLATYSDSGVSGSMLLGRRPAGREMIDAAKPGDLIVAAKLDRMFRSTTDALVMAERWKAQKIGLILCDFGNDPVTESAIGTVLFTVMAAFAQFERTVIRERIGDGIRAKREKGGYNGGNVPFGFSKVGSGAKAVLVKNEMELEHIRAARWHADNPNHGPTDIARMMAEQGMFGRDGKPYRRDVIFRMIQPRTDRPRIKYVAAEIQQGAVPCA